MAPTKKAGTRSVEEIIRGWNVASLDEIVEMFEVYSSSVDENKLEGNLEALYIWCQEDQIEDEFKMYKGCMETEFCKVLVRNWEYASRKNIDTKTVQINWKSMMPDAKCSILNLWLYYYESMICPMTFENFYINKAMDGMWRMMMDDGNYERCEYKSAKNALSMQNMSEVKEVIKALKEKGVDDKMKNIPKRFECTVGRGKCNVTYKEGKAKVGDQELQMEEKDKKILEDIMQKKDVITKMKEEIEEEEEEEEEKRQKTAVPPPPPSPPDNDCKEKKTLCERVTCVTNQYHTDKGGNPDWDQMWRDVGNRVDPLVDAISKADTKADSYCNDDRWNNNVVTFAEREVCKFIARGLHHIYSTQTGDGRTDDRAKNDQRFKRTMECVLLNDYVDKLKEKAKKKGNCDVERGINEAFKKSEQIKNETVPCKDHNNCQVCQKEEYKKCQINGQTLENELNKLLQKKEGDIQETMEEICKDCTKEPTLCERTKCVTTKWFKDRKSPSIGEQNWCTFWNTDVKGKLTGLSEKIAGGDREVHTLCEKIDGKNTTLSKAQKEACNYIVRGLKYIYGVRSGGSSMDRNTRIFKQTMYCVFLNAYADKLKEKNPTCITEDTIKEAFKKGNTKKEVWCLDKQNGNCAVCEREENYGTCKLDINKSLWKPEMCEIDKDDVKKKVDGLLNSDGKIKTTLNTISSTNNLCNRAQCVTVKWFEDRKNSDSSKQDWCTFWGAEDVGRVLRSLSTAMTNNNEKMDLYCNTIGGPDSAEKKACQYITRGLEHVYNSQETGTWRDKDAAKKKKNNQQFDRTMGCAFLNVYADRIKKTCNEAKEGIDHAFEKSEEIKKETSPCNKDNNCVTCKREENFGCTLHVKDDLLNMGASARCEGDRQNIQNKLGKMLDLTTNKDPQVKPSLTEINNICPKPQAAKPAATKPATTKPTNDHSGGGKTPTVDCSAGVVDAGVDLSACLPLDDDDSSAEPSAPPPPNEDLEAKRGQGGPVGAAGSTMGNVHVQKDRIQLPPDPSPTSPINSQTPSQISSPDGQASGGDDKTTQVNTVAEGQPQGGSGPTHGNSDPDQDPQLPASAGGSSVDVATPNPVQELQPQAPTSPVLPARPPPPPPPRRPSSSSPQQAPSLPRAKRTSLPKAGEDGSPSPSDLLIPYLPLAPVFLGLSAMTYLLWKYFFLGKKRRRHRREEQLISPPSEEKLLDHVDDQADGPHAYTLVKERRQQRSTPQRGRKKRAHRRGSGGGVRRRTIIDIHLQVLDEYQKGDLHSTKEDFLQIIVHEFMGRNFVKGENVPKEQVPLINIPEEQVQCLDSGFREEDFVPDEGCSKFRFRV